MVDLDQGRHTQGITIKDLQGKKKNSCVMSILHGHVSIQQHLTVCCLVLQL
jgi:hypothetical protein